MAKAEMTIRAVAELSPEVTQLLTEIRDRLPEPGKSWGTLPSTAPPNPTTQEWIRAEARRGALTDMLAVLDGWIEGAKANHEGNRHRVENAGEECWRTFTIEDIRNMIADAARGQGVVP